MPLEGLGLMATLSRFVTRLSVANQMVSVFGGISALLIILADALLRRSGVESARDGSFTWILGVVCVVLVVERWHALKSIAAHLPVFLEARLSAPDPGEERLARVERFTSAKLLVLALIVSAVAVIEGIDIFDLASDAQSSVPLIKVRAGVALQLAGGVGIALAAFTSLRGARSHHPHARLRS